MARKLIDRRAFAPTSCGSRTNRESFTASSVRSGGRRRPWWPVVLAAVVALCVLPADHADAAALTTVNWSVSNNQINATAVTYAYSFKTATAGTIKTITFAVSGAGLAGSPAIAMNYGIGAGTVSRSGQTITYTVTSAVSVSAGIPIYVEFSGLTNISSAGSYTTSITT